MILLQNDSLQIKEEQSISISILQNDSTGGLANIDLMVAIPPTHGNAFVQPNNQLFYSPTFNYFGLDSLQYQVCDSLNTCDTATVFIEISPVNDAPFAIDDIVVTFEEQVATIFPTQNDIDVDGDSLNVQLSKPPLHGNFALGENNSLVYLPKNNFIGWDTLSYICCDSLQICDEAFIYILVEAVNDPPNIETEHFETDVGKPVIINLLENDTDEENDSLNLSVVLGPTGGIISGDLQNSFTYFPNVNFSGLDTIYYAVCDDGAPIACDTSFATILVRGNGRPIAINDTIYVTDVEAACITILNNDFDPDNHQLFYILDALNNQITKKGKVFDEGNGIICFQAKRAYNGMDTFTYTLYDNGGLPQLSTTGTVYVFANKTNQQPEAMPDLVEIDQAATITFNILENDTDPEDDPLRFDVIEYPKGGSLNFDEEGNLTYAGNYYFYGKDELRYELCDSTDNCVQSSVFITVKEWSINDMLGAAPNAISPNGDGKNDYFTIRNIESYPNNELHIYNRWGQVVYQTEQYQNDWYGQNLNSEFTINDGTYYYILYVTTPFKEVKQQRGFIQIIQ